MLSRLKNPRVLRLTVFAMLFVALLVMPRPAHADFFSVGQVALDAILDGILSIVALVNALLGQLLNAAKEGLRIALSLSLNAILGLKVIDVAWGVMRDMANFVFILMLVAISFATILNVIPKLQAFHYKKALLSVIVAAVMMNFSLAIGKTVVLAFDQVAQIFIKIMPNLGDDLTKALPVNELVLDPKALIGPLSANQDAATDMSKDLTAAEAKRRAECLNEQKPPDVRYDFGFFKFGTINEQRKGLGDCNQEILAARRGTLKVAAGQEVTSQEAAAIDKLKASTPSGNTQQKTFLIASGIMSGFLILLLTLCLITPFLFLLLRILALWVLLFTAPVAWASYAIPGTSLFGSWWRYFIGWNAFGPVYLFVLIPGMIVLQSSGDLLTALSANGAAIGTASGLFQIFMFYAFAVLIFLGGLSVAVSSSFAGAVKGTMVLGDWAGKIGALDAKGGARLAGSITGADARIAARREQFAQKAGELRRRLPLKTYDERLEAQRLRLGVISGKEAADLRAKPVEEERKRIGSATFGMDKPKKDAYLRARMNSSNKTIKLAAREEMLKAGLLTDRQIEETKDLYGVVGSPARKAFEERVLRAPGAAAIERRKEEETKRSEIIASIQSKIKGVNPAADAAVVTSQLNPIFTQLADPTVPPEKKLALRRDLRAAEEAIGGKDPLLLKDYLDARGEPNAEERAFASVFKDSNRIMELPDEYLTLGNAKMASLKIAINNTYRNGGDKAKLRDRLLRADPTRTNEIYDLTT